MEPQTQAPKKAHKPKPLPVSEPEPTAMPEKCGTMGVTVTHFTTADAEKEIAPASDKVETSASNEKEKPEAEQPFGEEMAAASARMAQSNAAAMSGAPAPEKQKPLAPAVPVVNPLVDENGVLQAGDFTEGWKIASMMASSEMVPDAFRGKPAAVMMAMQTAKSRGLNPLTAIQQMANIFGRTITYGELPLAEVFASKKLKSFREWWFDPNGEEIKPTDFHTPIHGAACEVEALDCPQGKIIRIFTIDDAKNANLLDDPKRKTWRQYTKRMLQMRARGWALKDAAPEVTAGLEMPGYDEHNEEVTLGTTPGKPQAGQLASKMNQRMLGENKEGAEAGEPVQG